MNGVLRYLNCVSLSSAITDMFLADKDDKEPCLIFRGEKLKESIQKSLHLQKGKITEKHMNEMFLLYRRFETESDIVTKPDPPAMICFLLLIIEDLKSHMKNQEKIKVLDQVLTRLNWLLSHKLIDPKLDQHNSYIKAVDYYKQWQNIFK